MAKLLNEAQFFVDSLVTALAADFFVIASAEGNVQQAGLCAGIAVLGALQTFRLVGKELAKSMKPEAPSQLTTNTSPKNNL